MTRFLSSGKCANLRLICHSRCRMSICSPRYRVRDNPLVLWTESISSKLLSIDTKMVLLPSIRFFRFRLLRSLGTTQRHSRVLRLLCFPLTCQATRRCSCWVCAMGIDLAKSMLDTTCSVDLRDLSLTDCAIERFDRILCRWALNALLLSFFLCMELRPIVTGSKHFGCIIFFLLILSLAIDCEALVSHSASTSDR